MVLIVVAVLVTVVGVAAVVVVVALSMAVVGQQIVRTAVLVSPFPLCMPPADMLPYLILLMLTLFTNITRC